MARDYRAEYDKYQGTAVQKKNRAARNAARAKMMKAGKVSKGDGKDLGHFLEFKSELQISVDFVSNSQLGFSYNHLSNASIGDKNPGANSYMFNFLQNF